MPIGKRGTELEQGSLSLENLSVNVLDTILTVLGSVTASLVAVSLTSYLSNRSRKVITQREVYEGFITAAQVLVLRMSVFRDENSILSAILLPTFNNGSPVLMSLYFASKFKKPIELADLTHLITEAARRNIDSSSQQVTVTREHVYQGLEDLLRQWLRVRLVGSEEIVAAGGSVMEAAQSVIDILEPRSTLYFWRKKIIRTQIEEKQVTLKKELDAFIALTRKSEILPRSSS